MTRRPPLSTRTDTRILFTTLFRSMPVNYDPKQYELLKRQKQKQPWKSLHDVFIWSLMPNGKTNINNRNGFSTDMIGMNWDYPEGDYERRQQIIKIGRAHV